MKIAVLGGGPAGTFFAHAIRRLTEQNKHLEEEQEISVTCFEMSDRPGGLWKSKYGDDMAATVAAVTREEEKKEEHDPTTGSVNVTAVGKASNCPLGDNFWTNSPSHIMEFADYTFDEHFGGPVPLYLPRKDVEGYIIERVKKGCPDFFERYVQFNKKVLNVKYSEDTATFTVKVENLCSSQVEVHEGFDKCVWACGETNVPKQPEGTVQLLRSAGYKVLHSKEVGALKAGDVRDKHILLVGGGFSAEDLALRCIQLGAEKITVSTRDSEAPITWTTSWPEKKVKVLSEQTLVGVATGEGEKKCIQFAEVDTDFHDGYKRRDGEIETELYDVDLVVMCTGYKVDQSMMDPSLQAGYPAYGDVVKDVKFSMPQDWKMTENRFTQLVGDVEPSREICYYSAATHPHFYHGFLISNPNMIYMSTYDSDFLLGALDIYGWYQAQAVLGLIDLPSADEMRRQNLKQAMESMQDPIFRLEMDENYYERVYGMKQTRKWWNALWACETQVLDLQLRQLAVVTNAGQHPIQLGTGEELAENGNRVKKYMLAACDHREELEECSRAERLWRTFRDVEDTDQFTSLHTGTAAVPLDRRWMDIPS